MYELITILGPTACGKTAVATHLARRLASNHRINAEIISADSRQVFKGMDIGTGKDIVEYAGIPYHLIDIAEPGTKYSVFQFQHDFLKAYYDIRARGSMPILCGGTGLYLESVLRAYRLVEVPINTDLRKKLENKSLSELAEMLASYKRLHNTTDIDTARRAIRAIEIEDYYREHKIDQTQPFPHINSLNIGLDIPRELRRQRIASRLHHRLENENMIEEVQHLLDAGVSADALISYGLEYRYLTLHILGQLTYDDMVRQLQTAIHQFAKRQMTWFRGMQRRGIHINWIDATQNVEQIVNYIINIIICSAGV